jgi:hypothetical protein
MIQWLVASSSEAGAAELDIREPPRTPKAWLRFRLMGNSRPVGMEASDMDENFPNCLHGSTQMKGIQRKERQTDPLLVQS